MCPSCHRNSLVRREQARPQLPADDVGPLVVEQRQITVRLHPTGIRRPDQRLGGGTHRERLLEVLPTRLGDDSHLGCEPFDELALLRKHGSRHEQREIEVLVAGRLDPSSSSRWIASQIAYPYGLITIAPRTGEFSAKPARRTTSPYQAGKSLDWLSKAVALSRVEQHRVVTHY